MSYITKNYWTLIRKKLAFEMSDYSNKNALEFIDAYLLQIFMQMNHILQKAYFSCSRKNTRSG